MQTKQTKPAGSSMLNVGLTFVLFLSTLETGLGQSTLQFSAASYTVAESAGTAMLTVRRLNDTNTAVSVDFATADGTATNGLKYTATNGTLVFGPGETNGTILVPILNNGLVDGTKNFKVMLSNPTNAVLGTPTTNTVSITDNDVGVQFQLSASSVAEDAGVVRIGVVRGDDAILPVTVDFATTDLTATNGLDYTGFTTNISFAPTERLKFIPVPILNDGVKELVNKTFRVTLSNPVGVSLGTTKTTTVTIMDNDQGFQFEAANYYLAEDAGVALIGVLRGTDDTNSTVTVDYATANGSALDGEDYTGLTNTLSFAPGERRKVVSVPILNDGIKENLEYFRLTLSNPTGGAVLGSPTTATVYIRDNDPGVGFEQTLYTNAWGQAADFAVTVLRGNDTTLGPITVDYAFSNITAANGVDYSATNGTLAFAENETVKNLTIPILRERSGKTFRVALSNPTPGVTLGTATTTVTIKGDYATVAPPFETALTIRREWGVNVLNWAGGGQLQRADNPTGPWQTLTMATNPCTVQSPVSTAFYRVRRPRPVDLYVPSSYDGQTAMPLVVLLHGSGQTGEDVESWMQLRPLAESRAFLYCHPNGIIARSINPPTGTSGWNATDAINDYENTPVDDVAYLRGVIEEAGRRFAVDRKRLYVVGQSHGAFMAYHMACDSADLIAGIAIHAGATFLDPACCSPSEPVNILHISGTADALVGYWGGAFHRDDPPRNWPPFPGAFRTVEIWAGYNGASDPVTDSIPTLDLDGGLPGLDTVVTRYTTSLPGGAVELWTMLDSSHKPTLSAEFSPRVIDWLLAHPKP